MRFEYFIDSNNITYKKGDTLLVDFTESFNNIKAINSVLFDFDPIEAWDVNHNIYIRWSYDITENASIEQPYIVWSSWIQITENGAFVNDVDSIYSKLFRSDSENFNMQFKIVRNGTTNSARLINKITIDFENGVVEEQPEQTLYEDLSCCNKAICKPALDFSNGILVSTSSNLFRPYDIIKPAQSIYKQMSCAVGEMFGHCVRYFKTTPTKESGDALLKEYSLFNVTSVKDIKILLPDNEIPDNAIKFLPYDMDFGDGMECHIIKEHFERAFGQTSLPQEKDYIYFPLLDRIFEVHSAYLFKDFMGMDTFYKVMLYKWQDKLNVMRDNPEIDLYVDNLHSSFEDVLQPEVEKEFINTTKPSQYTTVAIGGYDYVRSHVNDKLIIQQKDLNNYYTIVSKNYYDLSSNMNHNDIAVRYKEYVSLNSDENISYTTWFCPKKLTKHKNTYDIILDGYNTNENKGLLVKLNYTNTLISSISVKFNSIDYEFNNLPTLTNGVWYGLCLNVYNEYKQISLHLWGIKYNPSNPSQNNSTDLLQIYNKTLDHTPNSLEPTTTNWLLRSCTLDMTNIRVWSEIIEEEKQSLILNQYIVKDQNLAIIIDNAIPALKLSKEFIR